MYTSVYRTAVAHHLSNGDTNQKYGFACTYQNGVNKYVLSGRFLIIRRRRDDDRLKNLRAGFRPDDELSLSPSLLFYLSYTNIIITISFRQSVLFLRVPYCCAVEKFWRNSSASFRRQCKFIAKSRRFHMLTQNERVRATLFAVAPLSARYL